MKTRQQAVELIHKRLHGKGVGYKEDVGCWHYGILELRELLDYIYEDFPTTDEYILNDKAYEAMLRIREEV